ncbi:hypothetical protein LCI18_010953 [Fusarium solani-melongenae]|uniref:Uncharacterized protein n=1 Tax=Fusarium solani subsp. cucurbitae TaxID=2747967 RepID=A0ACD3ZG07_FUSSC|nr:hypothetical protein LCI18_010953 [Fusarium solani-melongenae]
MSLQASPFEFKTLEYEPLPTPSSIRLLSLAKQQNNDGPIVCGTRLIECTLRTVDLDTSPVYKALSYRWGDPEQKSGHPDPVDYSSQHRWPVAINGRVHFVTINLYDALQQLFLDNVKDINKRFPPWNKTTLIRAAGGGDVDIVTRYLRLGAAVDLQDCWGKAALHYAAENGHLEIVKVLLRYGANDKIHTDKGLTPLAFAEQMRRGPHQQVADALRNADPLDKRRRNASAQTKQPGTGLYDLWIDAICINQDDIEERTAQVSQMSRIYSAAKSVIVWLGREDMTSQGAAWALRGRTVSERDMWDIKCLIGRSWFTRKWVIQEFCLPRAVEMWCGAFQVTCEQLLEYDLQRLLPALDASESPATNADQGRRGLGIWDILTLRRWFDQIRGAPLNCNSHISPPSLPALIALTWHFKATDPRDSIFALLGLVNQYSVEGTPCTLVADYSKSTEEVFLEAGRLFVEAKGRNEIPHWNKNPPEMLEPLEGLSFVQHDSPGSPTNPPSWVPDFHRGLTTARLWDSRFCASGDKSHAVIWPSDLHLLKVDGYLFDRVRITEHNQKLQHHTKLGESAPDLTAWFRMTLGLDVRCREAHDVSRVEVLWRTLMADDIWHTQPSIGRETFRKFICEHIQTSGEYARQLLSELRDDDSSQSLPSPEEIRDFEAAAARRLDAPDQDDRAVIYRAAERAFYASFKRFSPSRQLFRTKLGYLGLGPKSAKEGDQIWLIAGARTPPKLDAK